MSDPVLFVLLLAAVVIVSIVITEFASNTASAGIMLPIVFGISAVLGSERFPPESLMVACAIAGALDVELTKRGHYRLGQGQRDAEPGDIMHSVRLLWGTTVGALLVWQDSGEPIPLYGLPDALDRALICWSIGTNS